MVDLKALGWNADVEASFGELRDRTLAPGRVALEHNQVYRVLTADGEWLAEVAGRIKYEASGRHELPAVGDWVALRPPAAGGRAVIRAILPRRSRFSRKAAGRGTEEQVVASNIDTVFLVSSLDGHVKPRSIERYLILSRQSGAQPVVVLNKADLAADLTASVAEAAAVAGTTPVHAVSAHDGRGFEWLERYLGVGHTIALLGPSGAGKSSIVNRLAGHDLLATGVVREWDQRGRHTSVHRRLVVLDRGGVVIDTPGMRELQFWDVDESVDDTFKDLLEFGADCRFRDCRHDKEPGCAVKAAVDRGDLDAGRYASYLQLARERDELGIKREGRIGAKALRALNKQRQR